MKPILFNIEMVRALLEGRKTVTRRKIKPHREAIIENVWLDKEDGDVVVVYNDYYHIGEKGYIKPIYEVGDVLWVKEAWSFLNCEDCGENCREEHGENCGKPPDNFNNHEGCFVYRQNYGTTEDDSFPPSMFKWQPLNFMPKEAARTFLKVTGVKVERLQDITNEQADKEGFKSIACTNCYGLGCSDCAGSGLQEPGVVGFMDNWNSTVNKKDVDTYGWDANPWVWVIEFEVKK